MKKLRLQIFGRFSLTSEKGTLSENQMRSGKLTKLLVYLLMNRDQILTQQKLIETLLKEDFQNPEQTLRNLMYRLRTELKVLGDEKFINTFPGAYQWNPEVEVESDFEELEMLSASLRGLNPAVPADSVRIKEICSRILDLYQDNVTPRLSGELWIIPKMTRYQYIYLETAKFLCEVYAGERDWPALEVLGRKALEVSPYDEDLHCWVIRSLFHQKRPDQAARHYEAAKRSFYDDLGLNDIEKLRKTYQEMLSDRDNSQIEINVLINDMREEKKPKGGFICDYQIFREIYRMEARRLSRLGIAEYMVLFTLRRPDGIWKDAVSDSGLMAAMDQLEQIVSQSLRISDAATRFSPRQILLLLSGCSYENSLLVVNRICRAFRKKTGRKQLEIAYELEEVSGNNFLEPKDDGKAEKRKEGRMELA